MQGHLIGYCVEELKKRCLPDGGFSHAAGNGYRPDATAWAIVALLASSAHNDLINPARSRLAKDQLRDGRVSVSQNHPEAFWPTPLAILAWQGSAVHREPQSRAVEFLLNTTLGWCDTINEESLWSDAWYVLWLAKECKVSYLAAAGLCLGPISESDIPQLGESIQSVRTKFELLNYIPAQRELM